MELLATLEITTHPEANSCFRAWSTFALFDYFHDESPLSSHGQPDTSQEDEIEMATESTRTELQRLLQRAYLESWKIARDTK